MDENVLKLFADVGPQAGEVLESYINLKWAEFFFVGSMSFLVLSLVIFLVYKLITSEEE